MPYKDRAKHAAHHREYVKLHYIRNRAKYLMYAKDRTARMKDFIRQHKETRPCTDCQMFYPYYVMEFDHLRDKEWNISQMVWGAGSFRRIKEEMAKCELVCANCHKERSHKRRPQAESNCSLQIENLPS